MENERIEALLEEAKKVHECWRKDVKSLPTQLNIIELLHCNENAHSRILAELLKYERRFMKSFLEMSGLKLDDLEPDGLRLDIENAQIALEYPANVDNKNGRIDVLIYTKKYAIIIENKGNGAEEQSEQISRYVRALINEGYEKNNIYCLYLTQEGGMPSENSLKDEEAEILGFVRNNNSQFPEKSRLKPINYKYDILNWLRNDVLPNISYRDKILIDGLNHYIDYLETIYMLKHTNMENIKNYFNNKSVATCIDNLIDISIFEQELKRIVEEEFNKFGFNKIEYYWNTDKYPTFDIIARSKSKSKVEEAILIYKGEDGKYSLGWTGGYDEILGPKEDVNKYKFPDRKFENLENLFKTLTEKKEDIIKFNKNR